MDFIAGMLIVMTVFTLGVTVTGNQKEFCEHLGGTYKPAPPPADVCPGGDWSKLFRAAAKPASPK